MTELKFNKAAVKDINFHALTLDETVEALNGTLQHLKWAQEGNCKHAPSTIVVKASGDMAYRAEFTYCKYCGDQIEPVVHWILRKRENNDHRNTSNDLPSVPPAQSM